MPISEKDWKLLRQLKDSLLERYCEILLFSAQEIIEKQSESFHRRYLELYEFMQARDKALAIAFNDLRRSNAIERLAFIRHADLLTEIEFSQFTQDTRARVDHLVKLFESK